MQPLRTERLVVLFRRSVRPEVSTFEEPTEWFLEPMQTLQTLSGPPGCVFRLFLEIENLFHVCLVKVQPREGACCSSKFNFRPFCLFRPAASSFLWLSTLPRFNQKTPSVVESCRAEVEFSFLV